MPVAKFCLYKMLASTIKR